MEVVQEAPRPKFPLALLLAVPVEEAVAAVVAVVVVAVVQLRAGVVVVVRQMVPFLVEVEAVAQTVLACAWLA